MKLSSSYFTSHKSLSGVALYYLFENIALTFSSALILQKIPTRYTILGIALTLAGLILSQRRT